MITSSNFSKALYPGVSQWYGNAYAEWPSEYQSLFQLENSSRAYEEEVQVSSLGLAHRKPEGQGIVYDDETQGFITRYSHVVYALGFQITREMVEDDLYGIIGKRRSESLKFSMKQTKEIVAHNIYNRAFDGAFTGGDGVSMINAAHPNFAGGTQSNTLAVAADFAEASLEQACIDITKWTDDRGLKMSAGFTSVHIPAELMFVAERVLKTDGRVGTGNNDLNAIKSMGKFQKGLHVHNYLTDTNAWFIRTNVNNGPKFFTRRGEEFTSDNDHDTENAKYKTTERYSAGWTDWRGVYGTAGA